VNRQSIISALYLDKDINQAIGKMQPVELQDDLRQEMFLVLCELDEDRLVKMHAEGWLRFFLVRTMLNMVKSDRSTFHKKFRQSVIEYTQQHEPMSEPTEIDTTNLRELALTLHWYEREILFLYAETRNIVTLAKETKIPYRSLFKTITRAKQKLRQAMKQDNQGRLIGNYVTCTVEVRIDVNGQAQLDPEQMSELMEDLSAYIRGKIAGERYKDATIQVVGDLKIKKVL
jgi:DNA-directed RNA polymerase specialized sigma24 family protein